MRLSKYQLESDPDEVDVELGVFSREVRAREESGETRRRYACVFAGVGMKFRRLRTRLSNHARLELMVQVMPLHSMVSPQDQRKVFHTAPRGVRKVVLAGGYRRKRRSLSTMSYTSSIRKTEGKSAMRTAVSAIFVQ